ncbi:hypothetical protein [Nonomuraea sp. B1E8]|uniref:hypothetical protein n=1 Tax=unclassified Nonomuraea TaxID=2593643 RepID=UPI00325E2965
MTTTQYGQESSQPTPSFPARRKPRTFVISGIFALLLTGLASPLGLLGRLPVIGALLDRGGAVSGIAVLVVAISLWTVLFAVARLMTGSQERQAVAFVRGQLVSAPSTSQAADLRGLLVTQLRDSPLQNCLIARRVESLADSADAGQDGATTALSARSELDHALGEVLYVPARALVWALPALGFLGTASEMSRAVGGLGNSVGATTGYADLRNTLVSEVIPPLADAFGVTLFALGAGVLCHLLLTWTNSREQRILLEVEEATTEMLALIPGAPPATPAAFNGEIGRLVSELRVTRGVMQESANRVATLDVGRLAHLEQLQQLVPLLHSVDQRLDQIRTELTRELVITRPGAHTPRS